MWPAVFTSVSSAILLLCFVVLFIVAGVYFQFKFLMNIVKRVYPNVFWYQETSHYVLALTIDDAPSEHTNDILDLLDRFNCKATFFIISSQAKSK